MLRFLFVKSGCRVYSKLVLMFTQSNHDYSRILINPYLRTGLAVTLNKTLRFYSFRSFFIKDPDVFCGLRNIYQLTYMYNINYKTYFM